ncbi:ACT domain protein PheB [Veillonella sp. oral taxon 780 str. F0422]|nr:ACT domain protein PheB [Veillonella sp. oral taxon 780 str. F0422]
MDLSRSAYYKYKDYVFPFYELSQGKIVSINALISNESGMLSNILRIIADYNGSVLTINQNLPLQGVAHVNISFETKELTLPVEDVLHEVRQLEGVIKVELIGQA